MNRLSRPLPQRRSFVILSFSSIEIVEFKVATDIPAARNASTWLFIRASKGEMTMVMPWLMTAGS